MTGPPGRARPLAIAAALLAGCAAALAAAAGCRAPPAAQGLGRRLLGGEVLALRASADGAFVAALHGCEPMKDATLPPGSARCDLSVVPTRGGSPVRVARGVSTLAGGFAWSPRGASLAALGAYEPAEGKGVLSVWSERGGAREVARDVTFEALDREGARVAWVAGGQLFTAPVAGGAAAAVRGADRVATCEWGAAGGGVELLARRSARAGGELLAVRGGAADVVARAVRDYGFDRAGRRFAFTSGREQGLAAADAASGRPGRPLGREVSTFLFAPTGEGLAFLADAAPGRQGDLWIVPRAGAAPVRLAQRVGEPRWSADGRRLAWLAGYDPRSRTGALTTALVGEGGKPAVVARNVSDFDLAADGSAIAYLVHETAGGYSVDLGLARAGEAGVRVARGVFGFSFSPDGRWLHLRTRCVREAEACELARVPVATFAPGAAPQVVAEGVKSFEHAPGDRDRLLVTWARKDRVALDVAVWEAGKLTAVDTFALPGSVAFVAKDPTRLAYAVVEARRAGAYVAEVP